MDAFRLLSRQTNVKSKEFVSSKPPRNLPGSIDQSTQIEVSENGHHGAALLNSQTEPLQIKQVSQATLHNGDRLQSLRRKGKSSPADAKRFHAGEDVSSDTTLRTAKQWRQSMKNARLKSTIITCHRDVEACAFDHDDPGDMPTSRRRKHLLFQPLLQFGDMREKYGLSPTLAQNIFQNGYRVPTEVQMGGIPLALGLGKEEGLCEACSNSIDRETSQTDIVAVAPTGSGKTIAFLIPVLQSLIALRSRVKDLDIEEDQRSMSKKDQWNYLIQTSDGLPSQGVPQETPLALILAPTFELANQIADEGKFLTRGTGFRISALRKNMRLGGSLKRTDFDQFDSTDGSEEDGFLNKAEIIVSTPSLVVSSLSARPPDKASPLAFVRHLVLDEADILLSGRCRDQVCHIHEACINPRLQTSFWSATIASSIENLAQEMICARRRSLSQSVSCHAHHLVRLVVGLKDMAIPQMSHRLIYTASEKGKLLALRQLIHPEITASQKHPVLQPPFLVFTKNVERAIALQNELFYDISVEAGGSTRIAVVHTDLSENKRANIMATFRRGEIWILIATDALSRGLDFRGVNGVVNYDLPDTPAIYVHRVGRTGRQGRRGCIAVTFYAKDDISHIKSIAKVISTAEKAHVEADLPEKVDEQQRLLESLPDVPKKSRSARRPDSFGSRNGSRGKDSRNVLRASRISTKSGYDRSRRNRKIGHAKQRKLGHGTGTQMLELDQDEWVGFGA